MYIYLLSKVTRWVGSTLPSCVAERSTLHRKGWSKRQGNQREPKIEIVTLLAWFLLLRFFSVAQAGTKQSSASLEQAGLLNRNSCALLNQNAALQSKANMLILFIYFFTIFLLVRNPTSYEQLYNLLYNWQRLHLLFKRLLFKIFINYFSSLEYDTFGQISGWLCTALLMPSCVFLLNRCKASLLGTRLHYERC